MKSKGMTVKKHVELFFFDRVEFEIVSGETSLNPASGNESPEANEHGQSVVNLVFSQCSHHDDPIVIEAKQTELQNWRDMDVPIEVEDKSQKVFSTKWVVTEKTFPDGEKGAKARLMARGFKDEDQVPSDSPTAAKSTLRIMLAIIANDGWTIETIDIKAAFLRSRDMKGDVFVMPTVRGKNRRVVWKLKKTVYVLDEAFLERYFSVKEQLLRNGCKQSCLDKALFRGYNQ